MSRNLTSHPLLAPQTLLALAALPVLVWHGNPAVALLVGAALSLGFNKAVIPIASTLGKQALQAAIVLLGLKLNAAQLVQISSDYSLLVTAYVGLTICIGLLIGHWLGNQRKCSQLISTGTAICGGTTIASLSPVIGARPEQTGVALTLVFLLNALALFTFPLVGETLSLTQEQFGVWAALAIHDTSSVVATAAIYGDEAATVATTVKLGRTLWLIPLLLVFSVLEQRGSAKLRLPLFIVAFVATACLGSLIELPSEVVNGASMISKSLLVSALFCIGTEINRSTLKELRGAVLLHGLLLWALVVPLVLWLVTQIV
ncbi:MAG: putative sulfate exporter family transporter [Halioglobus sp.]